MAMSNPATLTALIGGPRSGDLIGGVNGGYGGGGLALISCRARVSIAGTIDAGGGGGFGSPFSTVGGGGGGAGGYVVVQGMEVALTGAIYANGGAGGSGVGNGFQGLPGEDGSRSTTVPAAGGATQNGSGQGGYGGWSAPPGTGKAPTQANATAGGGGGSPGFIQLYLPTGHTPTIAPIGVSPPLEPIAPIALR